MSREGLRSTSGHFKAVEEIISVTGTEPLYVYEFLVAVAEMQRRTLNFLYGRVRRKDWDGAVNLDQLFQGEHIPDDPTAYLDQRYIDYLAKNSEEM